MPISNVITSAAAAAAIGSFSSCFSEMVPPELHAEVLESEAPRNAGKPKLTHYQFTQLLVYNQMTRSGTLSDNAQLLHGVTISDAALSGRKQTLGWEFMQEILNRALVVSCNPELHPDAFYKGLRLLAVDGTSFDLANTPAILAAFTKAASPSGDGGQVAFARLNCSTLVELGSRQPLGVALGMQGEGELALLPQLLNQIPDQSLTIVDRLYGANYTFFTLSQRAATNGQHCLARIRENVKTTLVKVLPDGSRIVDVEVLHPDTKAPLGTMRLREIYGHVHVKGSGNTEVRIWTTLLDHKAHPALELMALYSKRWGHEVFYKELKEELHQGKRRLDAQTPVTAAQEVLALTLCCALVARQRMSVANRAGVAPVRVSFAKVLEHTNALSILFEMGRGILTSEQMLAMMERMMQLLTKIALIQQRKTARRCQRAKRKTASSFAKMTHPTSEPLILTYTVEAPNP